MEMRTLAHGLASWAQRNPLLWFLFIGVFLFRFVARNLVALLFHDPPRITLGDRPRCSLVTGTRQHPITPVS